MAKTISSSERILTLIKILKEYTDQEHELIIQEIKSYFYKIHGDDLHISSSNIRNDLNQLQESSLFEIITNQKENGFPKYYSHQYRQFEIHELRVLMDAVSSARFITVNDTNRLLDKIKTLTSKHQANKLDNLSYFDNKMKSENKKLKYFLHDIHTAISNRKMITFQYGRYDLDKEFVLSNGGIEYEIEPYSLIWNSDYYYLIGKIKNEAAMRHYRVDRMVNVKSTDVDFTVDNSFNITDYTRQLFHMYSGKEEWIEVQFKNQLINVIIDRFGKNIAIKKNNDDSFSLKTKAVISEGLVRWLLTWGADAKVISPIHLVNKMKDEANKINQLYS